MKIHEISYTNITIFFIESRMLLINLFNIIESFTTKRYKLMMMRKTKGIILFHHVNERQPKNTFYSQGKQNQKQWKKNEEKLICFDGKRDSLQIKFPIMKIYYLRRHIV